MKFTPVFYRTLAATLLLLHFFTGSLQAEHRVPLTMGDPWMTSSFHISDRLEIRLSPERARELHFRDQTLRSSHQRISFQTALLVFLFLRRRLYQRGRHRRRKSLFLLLLIACQVGRPAARRSPSAQRHVSRSKKVFDFRRRRR